MIRSAFLRSSPDRVFESLYRRHVKEVYGYCRAMLGRQADAEDATQTTFMNAYRALARGERPRDPGSWLRAVALNVCREHYRRAGRRPEEVSLNDDPGELVVEPAAPELADVVRGLSCLPFNQRSALVMREFEGRSLAEIAAALEVSSSAVEALLFRARRSLREQLEETLTCGEAEQAISRQLDGALPRRERGRLRAHLRECPDCAARARRVRAQRSALRSLALLPLPASLKLGKLTGGGAVPAAAASGPAAIPAGGPVLATVAGSAAVKVTAAALAGVAAVGVGFATLPRLASPAAAPSHRTVLASDRGASVKRALATSARPAARRDGVDAGGSSPAGVRHHPRLAAPTRPLPSTGASRTRGSRNGLRAHQHGSSSIAGGGAGHGQKVRAHGRGASSAAVAHASGPTQGNGHAFGRTKATKLHRPAAGAHQPHSPARSSAARASHVQGSHVHRTRARSSGSHGSLGHGSAGGVQHGHRA